MRRRRFTLSSPFQLFWTPNLQAIQTLNIECNSKQAYLKCNCTSSSSIEDKKIFPDNPQMVRSASPQLFFVRILFSAFHQFHECPRNNHNDQTIPKKKFNRTHPSINNLNSAIKSISISQAKEFKNDKDKLVVFLFWLMVV